MAGQSPCSCNVALRFIRSRRPFLSVILMGRSRSHCARMAAPPHALCRSATALHAAPHAIHPSIPQLLLSLPPYEAELMLRVSFMHMLFYLSSVPLSHPHGQHLPLASTRSLRVQLGGVAQVTLGCCWVGRYGRGRGGIMSSSAALSHSVVVSSALFHFPLPTKSRPRPGKCAAARCAAVVAACCTARRRAGLPAR